MAIKKTVWDLILKVVIAVASAIAGVVGANAMPLQEKLHYDFFPQARQSCFGLRNFICYVLIYIDTVRYNCLTLPSYSLKMAAQQFTKNPQILLKVSKKPLILHFTET